MILKTALKAELSEKQVQMMLREGKIQASIKSEFVIRVLECFETDSQIVTVLELASYGDFET